MDFNGGQRPTPSDAAQRQGLGRDFTLFFSGQLVSNLGNNITQFALPLLVYQITGSALNLGITMALTMLPYLFFGLIIGAWVDRVDRKRVVIWSDALRSLVLLTVPVLSWTGNLSVEWIYVVTFIVTTFEIASDAGQFAAIPSLVKTDDLVSANGRIRASYSVSAFLGPPLAGGLMLIVPLEAVLLADSVSFLFSIATLLLIRTSFNEGMDEDDALAGSTIRQDIVEGLRYVLSNPIMRAIAILMVLVNFLTAVIPAQIIYFAQTQLGASDPQTSFVFAAGSAGVIAMSLSAGPLRQRLPFGTVALGSLAAAGVLVVMLSGVSSLWLALPIWGLAMGMTVLFNICTGSLRQQITPPRLLGRVATSSEVMAWSLMPAGIFLGSLIVEEFGRIDLVYAVLGVSMVLLAIGFFAFSPLGRAERYIEQARATRDIPKNISIANAAD